MRRRVGLVLAGLGTCLIVFAVLMPTWVSSKVLKFPLNEYATATLTASNVSYFSPAKLTEMTGVNMEATYTIKGNAAAGSSSTAVWNQFIYVYDQTNKLPFQTMTRTFAFDRRTAQLINCCGANVSGDSSVEQSGVVGYVFPIGTQKQTYDVFDTNLNKPMPFTYAGTDTVNGIHAYRFEENVAPVQNGTQVVPGSLVGESQASVVLPQYYEMHLTYWIDPDTGALLNATEHEKLTLRNSQGAQALLLLDANLAMTPASVNGLVALDNSQRSKMTLVTTILPLVTGIVGVILLIVGILLSRRPREDVEGGTSATSAELAAAEPEDADRSAGPPRSPPWSPAWTTNPTKPPPSRPPSSKKPPSPKPLSPKLFSQKLFSQKPPRPKPPRPRPRPLTAQPPRPRPPKPRLARPRRPKLRPRLPTHPPLPRPKPPSLKPPSLKPRRPKPRRPKPRRPKPRRPKPPRRPRPRPRQRQPKPMPMLADAPGSRGARRRSRRSTQGRGRPSRSAYRRDVGGHGGESPEAAAANAPADAPATTSRRGRRGSHRR